MDEDRYTFEEVAAWLTERENWDAKSTLEYVTDDQTGLPRFVRELRKKEAWATLRGGSGEGDE